MMATDQVVAKRGDVLLELCKAGKPAGTLLVSSHVLSPASPAFETTFNGDFSKDKTSRWLCPNV
jgi:hypothetical protein